MLQQAISWDRVTEQGVITYTGYRETNYNFLKDIDVGISRSVALEPLVSISMRMGMYAQSSSM